MSYLIYSHTRNDTNEIFYIGKGNYKRPYDIYNRNRYWQNVVNKHGFSVQIIAEHELESDAYKHEIKLIAYHKKIGSPLVNLTDGGEGASGMPKSQETKAKISKAKKGVANPKMLGDLNPSKSKESRLKRSIAMKSYYANGNVNPMLGKKRSDLSLFNKLNPRLGSKNNKSRPIIIDNIRYESILIASKKIGIKAATLRMRAINQPSKYNTYFDKVVS